jgi:hypothetical protein
MDIKFTAKLEEAKRKQKLRKRNNNSFDDFITKQVIKYVNKMQKYLKNTNKISKKLDKYGVHEFYHIDVSDVYKSYMYYKHASKTTRKPDAQIFMRQYFKTNEGHGSAYFEHTMFNKIMDGIIKKLTPIITWLFSGVTITKTTDFEHMWMRRSPGIFGSRFNLNDNRVIQNGCYIKITNQTRINEIERERKNKIKAQRDLEDIQINKFIDEHVEFYVDQIKKNLKHTTQILEDNIKLGRHVLLNIDVEDLRKKYNRYGFKGPFYIFRKSDMRNYYINKYPHDTICVISKK